MEKLAYLLFEDRAQSGASLRTALCEKAFPAIRAAGGSQLGLSIDDEEVAADTTARISRSEPPIRALVTFWMQNSDDRAACEAALNAHAQQIAGYLVVESRPMVHEPPAGARAEGFNLVTAIPRKAGLTDEVFFDCWNREHREVALETQSTFAYVRNAIVRPLTANAPEFAGIVEESFPIGALTDPQVWYDCDNADELKRRLARMVASVQAFLDLSRLESIPMSEYYQG